MQFLKFFFYTFALSLNSAASERKNATAIKIIIFPWKPTITALSVLKFQFFFIEI